MSKELAFPKDRINILLLEGVHPAAIETFQAHGYSCDIRNESLGESELIEAVKGVHILGIRSKTLITEKVLEAADSLLGLGCFCLGTNQVDLPAAQRRGVPIFNSPFGNTRSVAELTIAEVVMLARKAVQRNTELHQGIWKKSAVGCMEVRGKTIGIVGYGNIGPQVGILAESLGMRVVYYDIAGKLPIGNAKALASLDDLLACSDFVTLHVPETPETRDMIGDREVAKMKEGSFLLNLSRGTVVKINALKKGLESGKIWGAAIDVYPVEPKSNDETFQSELCGIENVILTPHIGAGTVEAQQNIGVEVASAVVKFVDTGSTSGAVNFPEVELPVVQDSHRILNIHRNVPGVLSGINSLLAEVGVNIRSQYLSTLDEVGYLIMDVESELSGELKKRIEILDTNIRTRLLY